MNIAAHITYSGENSAAARDVARALEAAHLPATTSAVDRLQGLLDARCLVAILSPAAAENSNVRQDVTAALQSGKPLVAILLQGPASEGWMQRALDHNPTLDARTGLSAALVAHLVAQVREFTELGRTVAMLNIKGGVGKTVLSANIFAAAHLEAGKNVCLVDLDPQHNLTQFFLPAEERNEAREAAKTVFAVLTPSGPQAAPRAAFASLPRPLNRGKGARGKFDLVLGDDRLFQFTLDRHDSDVRAQALERFQQFIGELRQTYDLIVFDANPCATFLTRCAITSADHIVAPVRPEKYSLTGLNMLEQIVREIRGRPLRSSEFSVVLNATGDRPRSRSGLDVDHETRKELQTAPFFGTALLRAAIPYTVNLRTTPIDRYALNPIQATAMGHFTQRAIKEALAAAAAEIMARAGL
jgi:cellulose biosynthesis protein BcsQ